MRFLEKSLLFAWNLKKRMDDKSYVAWLTEAKSLATHVEKAFKLMEEFSRDGFSAKMQGKWLVLTHSSKPDYSLRLQLTSDKKAGSEMARIECCGPAYQADKDLHRDWERNGWEVCGTKFIWAAKRFELLVSDLKTRVLSLGEPDSQILEWFPKRLEKQLLPLGFTFFPNPKKGSIEFSHPSGLLGSISFGLFSISRHYPPPGLKAVLFTFNHPDYQKPYLRSWLHDNKPEKTVTDIQQIVALTLVHQEVSKKWKSDILIPKLNGDSLQLVNTQMKGEKSIILELTPNNDKLLLKGRDGYENNFSIVTHPNAVAAKEIARTMIGLADQHVQQFIRENGHYLTTVQEIDI
jgi:hypothetical protein